MSIQTRSQAKKRKIPESFDANNSFIESEEKRSRYVTDMSVGNQASTSQITDLSGTIRSGTGNNNTSGPSAGGTPIGGARSEPPGNGNVEVLRQQRALENNVCMIQNELGGLKNTIGQLSEAVKRLTELTLNRNVPSSPASNSGLGGLDNLSAPETGNNGNRPTNGNSVAGSVCSHFPNDTLRENKRVRIDKLGLRFDGISGGISVEEFVYRLEYFQGQYHIPWAEILRDFSLIVSGPAESWYWLSLKTNKFSDWPSLKHSLLSQYQSTRSNFEIVTELAQRKQQPNESIDTFFHIMGQIRAKLVQPISEYDMMKILKKNVKESVARIIYPIQVSSVEQLRIECNEAEKNFPRREIRPVLPSRPIRQVSEIYAEGSSECDHESSKCEEVSAIQFIRKTKPTLLCWNCQKQGHTFRNCDSTERNLFCYRCGKPGTISPKCPSCKQGNLNQGVEYAGGPRPILNSPRSEK